MSSEKINKVILENLSGLLQGLNSDIRCVISPNGDSMIVDNVTEDNLSNFPLITNFPENNFTLKFIKLQVFLENHFEPSYVFGINPILQQKIILENSKAFADNKKTYKPFLNFSSKIKNVNYLIDELSGLCDISPDTRNKVKTYRLYFENIPF